jgi:2-hydroxychromene-2-carboxylate isomerase
MTHTVDLFWSFRSPYSYLATSRIVRLRQEYDLDVVVRPVYPIAIRNPEFFSDVNPMWIPYLVRDIGRVAEINGIPMRWPRPDPVVMNNETREISKDQPYIHRLTRLGIAASETGDGLAFIDEISQLLWNGDVAGWDQGNHLEKAATKAGFDLSVLDEMIDGKADVYDAKIADNQKALEASGHWGVPTLAFENEAFFGQDRIDHCVWRMKQHGLQKRGD